MTDQQTWTVLRLLEWTSSYLTEHGAETARLDAEVMLARAMGCQRIDLYTRFDEEATQEVRDAFREMVRRRAEGTPVAYLVGEKEFYSRAFQVSPAVLIPRPETEFILVELLDLVTDAGRQSPWRILDVGTGSGILAICAAAELPKSQVTAIEISSAALEIATQNATRHEVADRIDFQEGDLLTGIADVEPFDFILSNPPYVSVAEYDQLEKTVREFEPRAALVGGETGAELIQRLVPMAVERLKIGGWLILEFSPTTRDAVVATFASEPGLGPASIRDDLAGHARVIKAQRV